MKVKGVVTVSLVRNANLHGNMISAPGGGDVFHGEYLRASVRKHQTYCGKNGKFDFCHILMFDRLGYN